MREHIMRLLVLVFPTIVALSLNEFIKSMIKKKPGCDSTQQIGLFTYALIAFIATVLFFASINYNK